MPLTQDPATAVAACIYSLAVFVFAIVLLADWIRSFQKIKQYAIYGVLAGVIFIGMDLSLLALISSSVTPLRIVMAVLADGVAFTRTAGITMLGMFYCATMGYPHLPLIAPRLDAWLKSRAKPQDSPAPAPQPVSQAVSSEPQPLAEPVATDEGAAETPGTPPEPMPALAAQAAESWSPALAAQAESPSTPSSVEQAPLPGDQAAGLGVPASIEPMILPDNPAGEPPTPAIQAAPANAEPAPLPEPIFKFTPIRYAASVLGVVLVGCLYSVVLFKLTSPHIGAIIRSIAGNSLEQANQAPSLIQTFFVLEFAFGEEILFRLGIQNLMARYFRWQGNRYWLAIVVAALLWTLGHTGSLDPNWVKLIQVLPVGLMLGWLFKKYGIESSIIAHGLFNIIMAWLAPFVLT